MPLIWLQVAMPSCHFSIFHKFLDRYFDRYVFKYRYKTLVSVKLHYGTKNFLFTNLDFKKTYCTWETKGNVPQYDVHTVSFFFILVFFCKHSWITGLEGNGEGISVTPHYHFHPLHRHLDISRVIAAERSPLHIASSQTWTENLSFSSTNR